MNNYFFNTFANLKFEISNWITTFFIFMSLCFMGFSGGILALETFLTIFIYFVFIYCLPYTNIWIFKKPPLGTPIIFPSFCNSIVVFSLFILFGFLNNYSQIDYKEITIKNNLCSSFSTCDNLYISNLPPSFSINNFLLKRFWSNNEIVYSYINNEVVDLKNKNNSTQKSNQKITEVKKEKFDHTKFFKLESKPFNSELKNITFDFFNVFAPITPTFLVTEDNSLLDTFTIKDNLNNKKMCFVENIDKFFLQNQFEIYIQNNQILIRTLYEIPNSINLEQNIQKILLECSSHD